MTESFCLHRRILACQQIYWNKDKYIKKTILVRSELIDQTKSSYCPSITVEKFGKCNVIGYAQCRLNPIDSTSEIKRTILSDVFRIQTNTNKIWIHRRFLSSVTNVDQLINVLLSNTKLFKIYYGMGMTIEKPTFTRVTQPVNSLKPSNDIISIPKQSLTPLSAASSLSTFNQLNQFKPLNSNNSNNSLTSLNQINQTKEIKEIPSQRKSNEIPSFSSLFDSTNSSNLQQNKNTLPSLTSEITSSKQQLQPLSSLNVNGNSQSSNLPQFTTLNSLNNFKPVNTLNPINSITKSTTPLQSLTSLIKPKIEKSNSLSIQRKSTQIFTTISLNTIKTIYTIGFECLTNNTTTRLLAGNIFGELVNYPMKLTNEHDINKYTFDILQIIDTSFTKHIANFLKILF